MSDRKPEREDTRAREADLVAAYYLDESDPDIPILRREDGTFVAAFSSSGATTEGIVEAAREDYKVLLGRARESEEGAAQEGGEISFGSSGNRLKEAGSPRIPQMD